MHDSTKCRAVKFYASLCGSFQKKFFVFAIRGFIVLSAWKWHFGIYLYLPSHFWAFAGEKRCVVSFSLPSAADSHREEMTNWCYLATIHVCNLPWHGIYREMFFVHPEFVHSSEEKTRAATLKKKLGYKNVRVYQKTAENLQTWNWQISVCLGS